MRTEIEALRTTCTKAIERRRSAAVAVKSERKALAAARERLANTLAAQAVIQSVAAEVQSRAHKRVAAVVSRCLAAAFPGDGYSFAMSFDRKRGKTECRMRFTKHGHEIDPMEEDSGGVTQVAAFGLRLACLMLATPRKRKLLVIDEGFAMVSAEYLPNVATMLETLSRELGVQVLLVTHNKELRVGRVIELGVKK